MHPMLAAVLAAALGQAAPAPAPQDPGPPAPPAAGRVVTLLGGLALGGADQVARRFNGLAAVELATVFDVGPARAGVMLSVGERCGAGAWSLSLLGGRAVRAQASTEVDLLAELGVLGLWQHGASTLFSRTSVSGGRAAVPFGGLRAVVRPSAEPGGAALGLFVQRTFGSVAAPYRFTRCTLLSACTTEDKVARYGGLAVGLSFEVVWYGRAPPRREGAPGGGRPPDEPPPAVAPW